MTKGDPKDVRSTGRKRARLVLFRSGRPYRCQTCLVTSINLPPDTPREFDSESQWPKENRRLKSSLQAQHINKNLLDVDTVNLKWLCPSCHKLEDLQTDKGVSLKVDEFGYGW